MATIGIEAGAELILGNAIATPQFLAPEDFKIDFDIILQSTPRCPSHSLPVISSV
jgi:hypothetical protein